jgi:hypothetical protein
MQLKAPPTAEQIGGLHGLSSVKTVSDCFGRLKHYLLSIFIDGGN